MDKENYNIRIEVRDINGVLVINEAGDKKIDISNVSMLVKPEYINKELRKIVDTMSVWTNGERNIEVTASLFNSISETYMEMAKEVYIATRELPLRILFGSDVVYAYERGLDVLIELIEGGETYAIESFDRKGGTLAILEAAQGWDDYSILAEDDYKKIKDL